MDILDAVSSIKQRLCAIKCSVGRSAYYSDINSDNFFFFFFVVQGSLSRSKKKGKHEVLSIINKLLHETKVQKVDFIQSNRSSF